MAKHFQRHHPLKESKVVYSEFQTQFRQTSGQFTKLDESFQLLNQLHHLANIVKVNHSKDNVSSQKHMTPPRNSLDTEGMLFLLSDDVCLDPLFSNVFPFLYYFTHFLQSWFIDFPLSETIFEYLI